MKKDNAVGSSSSSSASSSSSRLQLPDWVGPVPDPHKNASAGLPPVPDATHIEVYSAGPTSKPNPFGLYNHGPMITFFAGKYWMSWYNSPRDEDKFKRSVFATSPDGESWSAPQVLFDNFTLPGEENGPWTILGDGDGARLYTQSGTKDAGLHIETIASVMRRVGADGSLGPVFWLNKTVPKEFEHLGFPTYLDMDATTRADAETLLASQVRTLVKYPDDEQVEKAVLSSDRMAFNERSLYMVPGSRQLVNLLRGGGKPYLYASTCLLPQVPVVEDRTLFSCRPGVGDRFTNLVEIVKDANNASEPRTCDWTPPVQITVPDSHSRTCASTLPDNGGIYLVGNQIAKGRDPVTLAIARDGLLFTQHWSVRSGAPKVRFPGHAKGPGFQYPGAMVKDGMMWVSYSIGKEDIGVTRFPLSSIGLGL